jgi:hypothetical protein
MLFELSVELHLVLDLAEEFGQFDLKHFCALLSARQQIDLNLSFRELASLRVPAYRRFSLSNGLPEFLLLVLDGD